MITSRTHRHRGQRGAAMVEMAIILPILIVLVFGIIHFGIAFNRLQGFHAAAREGARTASIPSNDFSDVKLSVDAAMVGVTDDYEVPPPNPARCAGHRGEPITVIVPGEYVVTIPLLPPITVNLTGRGVFRCE